MLYTSRNLLISILVLQLLLISTADSAFDWFKKKDEKKEVEVTKKPIQKGEVPGNLKGAESVGRRSQPQRDEFDDEEVEEESSAKQGRSKPDSLVERMNKIKVQKGDKEPNHEHQDEAATHAGKSKKRPDLDKIREATRAQERFESETKAARPRLPNESEHDSKVQGQGRRAEARRRRQQEEEEEAARKQRDRADDDEEDEDEEESDEESDDEAQRGHGKEDFAASNLLDRLKNKKIRNHAATKFVSTKPQEGAASGLKPSLEFLKTSPVVKSSAISGNIKKNKLITGSYWQKKFDAAYKATKKGIKESAKVISEMPKYMEKSIDSLNAFLQLDSKGKILALIEEANGDANFVRKEFSQFTLSWSPIMEKALDYLGDTDLDKIKLSDKDGLDLKKDALNSLAFGYEFMRLMIIWRQNLLLAHEAFKTWLETVKEEVERKTIELDENVIIQLRTTHTYMTLVTWMTIEEAAHEARTKLDYLMDVMDDRPKNYESEYFRNIVVLQELYEPTIEEFDKERDQVVNSISESGVVVDNLSGVDEFFENFRTSLASHKMAGVDWEVPEQLEEFMSKLKPQLASSSLVYTKAFLKQLGLRRK